MDLTHSNGQALPYVRLPLGIIRSQDLAEDVDQLNQICDSPGHCPLKMSTAYRKQRTRFPYKRRGKSG